jgi:membrane-associated phospholipid phosphatase
MIQSRGAIVKPPFTTELQSHWKPGTTPPEIDATPPMRKWEPLIRFNVCLMELLSDLSFETVAPAGGARATGARIVFNHRTSDTAYTKIPVVQLDRPEDLGIFDKQLGLVFEWARYREERASEILAQLVPQTPFWSSVAHLQPTRCKYTYELIEVALAFASMAAMRFKQAFDCPRPVAFTPKIQPMVPTPEHSTLPSGHATEAFAVAHVLGCLIPGPNGLVVWRQLNALAARIAINRTVAGVHFPMDSMAGRLLGATLGEYLAYQCSPDPLPSLARPGNTPTHAGWLDRTFSLGLAQAGNDFLVDKELDENAEHNPLVDAAATRTCKPVLAWLWEQARAEVA